MLQGIPRSAICVQNFDDSLSFAIRTTYRISLRSSSLREPRYPLLKVVQVNFFATSIEISCISQIQNQSWVHWCKELFIPEGKNNSGKVQSLPPKRQTIHSTSSKVRKLSRVNNQTHQKTYMIFVNDPSAGSPTETLLRLLLPLNDKIYFASRRSRQANPLTPSVHDIHRIIQSVGATGGVYKGQGRNQCKLMTCVY